MEKEKVEYLAVCPKCERFYNVPDDKVSYFCNHTDDNSWLIRYTDVALHPVKDVFTERVKCQVVKK